MRYLFQYQLPPMICGFGAVYCDSAGITPFPLGIGLVLAGIIAGILKTKYEMRNRP